MCGCGKNGVYACVYVAVCVFVHVCMCICGSVCICTCTCACVYMYIPYMNLNKALIKSMNSTRFMTLVSAFVFGQISINTSTLIIILHFLLHLLMLCSDYHVYYISDHFQLLHLWFSVHNFILS